MKKNLILLFVLCLLLLLPKKIFAADDVLCGFCPELCGGSSGNNISSGEYFKCNPEGGNFFTLCKNSGCTTKERFRYDGSYIYHVEDIPWSGDYGDEKCNNTGENAIGIRFDPGVDPYTGTPGMKWVRQGMTVGENFNQTGSGTVIGRGVASGQICQTPHSGTIDHAMQFTYRGCIKFPNGVVSLDTLEFHITGGGGAGEQFFYNMSKQKGWIGFNRGIPNSGAYVTDQIDTLTTGITCKEITIEPGSSSSGFSQLPSECNLNNPGDQTSRPVPCEACNQTSNMVSDCATTFTVSDEVDFKKKDGEQCVDSDNVSYWVDSEWGGQITLNTKDTIIPFVGKKGEEDEGLYLADYYEGTNLYYDSVCDVADTNCLKKAINEGGVWRKLASPELQDLLKRDMIKRVAGSKNGNITEGAVRDYLVVYQKPNQAALSARVSEIGNHQPPLPSEDDYEQKYASWKDSEEGKWFYLWAAMPMFSREDTIGQVVPYLGRNQLDQFTIQDPEKSTIERVPHLARLYEVTSAINQLILPQLLQTNGITKTNTDNVIASSQKPTGKPKLLASNESLLAEASCQNCVVPSIINPSVDNGSLHYTLQICPSCSGQGTIGDVYMGSCANPSQVHNVSPSCFTSDNTAVAPPVPISCPGTATICAAVRANRDVDDSCRGQTLATSCTVTVDADCKIVDSNCGAAPPAPKCGTLPVQSVEECNKEAETGYGDPICCGPISVDLKAVDRIQNTEHTGCNPLAYPFGGDPCEDTVGPFQVNRRIGVALSHPYLEQIWKNTTDISTGFLNIFRLVGFLPFEDKEAKSQIQYSGVNANPTNGDFYYPHLGGIQKAKEFVINELSNTLP